MQLQNQIEVYEVVFDELLKEKDPKEIDLKLRRSPRMKKVQIQTIRPFSRMFYIFHLPAIRETCSQHRQISKMGLLKP